MDWGGREKRRFVRAHFPCRVTVHTPEEHVINTHTENIGAGGLKLVIAEKLEVGVLVGLEIYLDSETITCQGRIVWVVEGKPIPDKPVFYDSGIEFYQIDENDQKVIAAFVGSIVESS